MKPQGKQQQKIYLPTWDYKHLKIKIMTTEIMINKLGSMLPGKLNFSETANAFLSNGYTSAANNTYFWAIRLAEGLIIKEDVGEGYARTFLNGLRIYSIKDKVLLADRSYHCNFYSKEKVQSETKKILFELLEEAAEANGFKINRYEAGKAIEKILDNAFKGNQLSIAENQMRKQLTY